MHHLDVLREGGALKIEQNGSESSEVSANGSFIIVRVPVQVLGEAPQGRVTSRYSVGGFVGLETELPARSGTPTRLTFRIPKELFRDRQYLKLEVLTTGDKGAQQIVWTKRFEASWAGATPHMGPVVDLLQEEFGPKP